MKTLTLLSCITYLAATLAGCGTDPILLGELIGATNDDDDANAPANDVPPDGEDPTPEDPYPPPGEPAEPSELEKAALDILRVNCGNCHIGTEAAGDFGYVDDVDLMIASGMIIPGSRGDSPLYVRMDNQTMPPAFERQQRPTLGQIDLVGYFIDELE